MNFAIRCAIRAIGLAWLLYTCSVPAWAQDCHGAARMIVGFSAGGGADTHARLLAERMTARSGRPVIVENKPGAAGNLAAEYVAKAAADGCTLLLTGNNHNVNPFIYARAGYDPQKDFAPIIRTVEGASMLVTNPAQPYRTVAELVQYAKANPGKLSYGSSGIGGVNHVAMELFLKSAQINVVHVPYKGAAPALTDAIGGSVPLTVISTAGAQPYIASGKLTPLVVLGPTRSPALPDVPTALEAGYPDAAYVIWNGILAPSGTPLAVREKLNADLRAILQEKTVRDALGAQGWEPAGGSVADFAAFLDHDLSVSRKLMQELKLKVE
jgi:tripartite-type tricarboxylate transporter receptor subunit TctC